MFIDSLRRGGFMLIAYAVIAAVCGRAMIARALGARGTPWRAPKAPLPGRPAAPTHATRRHAVPQQG